MKLSTRIIDTDRMKLMREKIKDFGNEYILYLFGSELIKN